METFPFIAGTIVIDVVVNGVCSVEFPFFFANEFHVLLLPRDGIELGEENVSNFIIRQQNKKRYI